MDTNTYLQASSSLGGTGGNIRIVSGPDVSFSGTNTTPTNIRVTGTTPLNATFSTGGIAAAPPENVVEVNGGTVTINGTSGLVAFGGNVRVTATALLGALFGAPPSRGGDPPGQVRENPASTNQNPGQTGGSEGPPGLNLFLHPGLIMNPAGPTPPGQQQAPPGQLKKASVQDQQDRVLACDDQSSYIPVSFVQVVAPKSVPAVEVVAFSSETADIYASADSNLLKGSDREFRLEQGTIVANARTNMRLNIADVEIEVQGGTLAFIHRQGNQICIRDLTDRSSVGIRVSTPEQQIVLHPGQEVSLAKGENSFTDMIGRRDVQSLGGRSWKATTAEYSFVSLYGKNKLVASIVSGYGDRRLVDRILKTHSSLILIRAKHGAFR